MTTKNSDQVYDYFMDIFNTIEDQLTYDKIYEFTDIGHLIKSIDKDGCKVITIKTRFGFVSICEEINDLRNRNDIVIKIPRIETIYRILDYVFRPATLRQITLITGLYTLGNSIYTTGKNISDIIEDIAKDFELQNNKF